MRRRSILPPAVIMLALLALLAAGLLAPAALARSYRPVVKKLTPSTCSESGGATVVITGKYFRLNGRRVVRAVTFGGKAATHVRVKSATTIKCVAPKGAGTVHVRVTTTRGMSRRVSADKFTYEIGPAAQLALHAGDAQTASAGTAVAVAPSVLVESAEDHPVAGVHVTFAVATGGGSVTGADAVSDASGVATVGGWTLGGTAGVNTLTATAAGLAGSPVTFSATGDAGILTVKQQGTAIRSYSLAELQGLAVFTGWAGLNKTPVVGPDAVTGAKVTDIVADALGVALADGQSVEVSEVDATPYSKTMSYDQLVNLTGFTYFDATTKDAMTPTGDLAAILIYSDPAGAVMPADSGPLRFAVADATSENMVYAPTSSSVSKVNVLNVIGPATQMSLSAGDAQTASAGTAVAVKPCVLLKDASDSPVAGVHVTFAVATGGGSITGGDAVTNASGIATVGSWKLGGTAGANTLTATCTGLTGSPVTFTATGDAGILSVLQAGVPVRSYSLTELQALTPFAGWAGLFKNPALGPDAVTGAKVTDIVADALGTPLAVSQTVEVTNYVDPPASPYTKSFTHDQLVNLAGSATFSYYDATSRSTMVPAGTLAAILIYSDPGGIVMPVANGPLRFAVADATSENMAYGPTNTSVSTVNRLNVITTP